MARIDLDIGRLDQELPARRHRIARVDRKVQDRRLEFRRIDLHAPGILNQAGPDHDLLAERALKQIRHRGNQQVDVEQLRFERLAPGERQQFLRQPCSLSCAPVGILERAR
jgi:hypothetical protein